jgi:SAM-dependent methyltransferase
MPDLTELADRWKTDLAAWAIPGHITAAVSESPWVLPRQVFARRADRLAGAPCGPSYQREWAALDPPGSVLDVGSGAGAACLPLLRRATSLTAVDTDPGMLELLAQRAVSMGTAASQVLGSWPAVAATTPPADVVTCHHVVYNVPEPVSFLSELTSHARRRVVVETTAKHPLTTLNPFWLKFHGLQRPVTPVAANLLEILTAMGLRPRSETWTRDGAPDYASFDELVDVTRRRLCLPPQRAGDVGAALAEAGIDPVHPVDLGSSGREVVTIWWDGNSPEI